MSQTNNQRAKSDMQRTTPARAVGPLSIQAMAWAIEQQEVTEPSTRFVLLCLCNYADVSGDAIFPSVSRLERDTGLGRRAIQYQLRKLEQAGILVRSNPQIAISRVSRRDRAPTCYRVNITGRNQLHPVDTRGAMPYFTGRNLEQHGAQPIAPDPGLSVREPKSVLQTVEAEIIQRFGTRPTSALVNRLAQQKRLRK